MFVEKEGRTQVLLFPALLSVSCTIYTQEQEQAGEMVPMTCVFRNQPNNISTWAAMAVWLTDG